MRIDVFQDIACPWCRIGKRHLEQALERWQGEPVEVFYRSFLLDPTIPPEGRDFSAYMQAKAGGRAPQGGWFEAPREMGRRVGLVFNFEQIEHAPNTLLSHRLIALAPPEKQPALVDAVYAAYFEHGRNIGSLDVLLEIAAAHGLDAADLRPRLEAREAESQVLDDYDYAREAGISGVPFFVFNEQYGVSGAQPPEVILQVMERVASEGSA
jgi:predicted DsbA family dithiol-disulfide isomerase